MKNVKEIAKSMTSKDVADGAAFLLLFMSFIAALVMFWAATP